MNEHHWIIQFTFPLMPNDEADNKRRMSTTGKYTREGAKAKAIKCLRNLGLGASTRMLCPATGEYVVFSFPANATTAVGARIEERSGREFFRSVPS